MAYAALDFSHLPRVGFAHHFYMDKYMQKHRRKENSIEIVYIKEGDAVLEAFGRMFDIKKGSIVLLFRCEPFCIYSADGTSHKHCSVQLNLDYTLTVLEDGELPPESFEGLLLPFVLPPCGETESIKKDLYTIVSDIGISRAKRSKTAAALAMGILGKLDQVHRREAASERTGTSLLEYKIKTYIASHIHKNITLQDLSDALGKTPNYLNSAFRQATGISIHRYINNEKVRLIAEVMEGREVSFKTACESVSIMDVAYGYRLFKKHMGVTLRTYLSSEYREGMLKSKD